MTLTGRDGPSFIEVARRAQIVSSAIDTIAELGYAQASLTRIAERAGISKSVISYHFAGKDELIRQVVADVGASAAAVMWPRVRDEASSAGMVQAYITANVDFIRTHPRQVAAVTEILTHYRARLDEAGAEATPLEERLRQGQHDGEFRAFDPKVMAWTIRAAIDEVGRRFTVDPGLDLAVCAAELGTLFDLATRPT